MRKVPLISLVFFLAASLAVSGSNPSIMAHNKFLVDFVNHEYINILAVIVTVSLVSVVQIHLEYTRVERRFKLRVFQDARRAVNLSALILVSLLIFGFIISFLRAQFDDDMSKSIIHCLALLTVLEAIFVMYDLVKTVYALASDEPIEGDEGSDDAT